MKKQLLLLLAFMCVVSLYSAKRQMETLSRGAYAVHMSTSKVHISWRILGDDVPGTMFNLYRITTLKDTVKIKSNSTISTYIDNSSYNGARYVIRPVINGLEIKNKETIVQAITPKAVISQVAAVRQIELRTPKPDTIRVNGTPYNGILYRGEEKNAPNHIVANAGTYYTYTYTPGSIAVGDVDGDGEYELILKWNPDLHCDNAETGYTGNVYIDCYKLDGTFLWRIDMGRNIRAGNHYTQMMVYDLDGDGKAEVVMKTADGTVDGLGQVIGNKDADWRYHSTSCTSSQRQGYILQGDEFLTVFEGATGKNLCTVPYEPGRGTVSSWGDAYGNRVDRYLACIAYLDGVHPSVVMCRGYYNRTTLAAYDFKDGKLTKRWLFDSKSGGNNSAVEGQGNHNLAVGDVDGNGFDEIIYGSCAFNHDGTLRYSTGKKHGDAGHLSKMIPDRPGLQYFQCHEYENRTTLRDAGTGEILFTQSASTGDNGRAMAADIDSRHPGFELWSYGWNNCWAVDGKQVSTNRPRAANFRVYWDDDLQDEIMDNSRIDKWSFSSATATDAKEKTILNMRGTSNTWTKYTPMISADLFGDWREEVILYEQSGSGVNTKTFLNIHSTLYDTQHGMYTLMHDPVYRLSVAWQNVAYNQPPHLGIYIGDGMPTQMPDIYTVGSETSIIYFAVNGLLGTVQDQEKTISLELPYGTDVTAITPEIFISKGSASYSPKGAVDFSKGPVTYTLTDGEKEITYQVSVTSKQTADSNNRLATLSVAGKVGVIDHDAATVRVTLPYNTTAMSGLKVVYQLESEFSHADIIDGDTIDFTNGSAVINVTAQDNMVKTYTITPEKDAKPWVAIFSKTDTPEYDANLLEALSAYTVKYQLSAESVPSNIEEVYADYDLIIMHSNTSGGNVYANAMKQFVGIKPMLSLKMFNYNGTTRWNWSSSASDAPALTTTSVYVCDEALAHPIFKDVTINNNMLNLFTENQLPVVKGVQSVLDFKTMPADLSVNNHVIATLTSTDTRINIHELSKNDIKFMGFGYSFEGVPSSHTYWNENMKRMLKNAAAYLLDSKANYYKNPNGQQNVVRKNIYYYDGFIFNPSAESINVYHSVNGLVKLSSDLEINVQELPKGVYIAKSKNGEVLKFIR